MNRMYTLDGKPSSVQGARGSISRALAALLLSLTSSSVPAQAGEDVLLLGYGIREYRDVDRFLVQLDEAYQDAPEPHFDSNSVLLSGHIGGDALFHGLLLGRAAPRAEGKESH